MTLKGENERPNLFKRNKNKFDILYKSERYRMFKNFMQNNCKEKEKIPFIHESKNKL